jgi:hypothetical protein
MQCYNGISLYYWTAGTEFQHYMNNKITHHSLCKQTNPFTWMWRTWNFKSMVNAQMTVSIIFNATYWQYEFIMLHNTAFPSTTAWHQPLLIIIWKPQVISVCPIPLPQARCLEYLQQNISHMKGHDISYTSLGMWICHPYFRHICNTVKCAY